MVLLAIALLAVDVRANGGIACHEHDDESI